MNDPGVWRVCNVCKKPIRYGAIYHRCSVSTCNGPRKNFVFCTFGCWDAHLPGQNHRNPECVEETAPSR